MRAVFLTAVLAVSGLGAGCSHTSPAGARKPASSDTILKEPIARADFDVEIKDAYGANDPRSKLRTKQGENTVTIPCKESTGWIRLKVLGYPRNKVGKGKPFKFSGQYWVGRQIARVAYSKACLKAAADRVLTTRLKCADAELGCSGIQALLRKACGDEFELDHYMASSIELEDLMRAGNGDSCLYGLDKECSSGASYAAVDLKSYDSDYSQTLELHFTGDAKQFTWDQVGTCLSGSGINIGRLAPLHEPDPASAPAAAPAGREGHE